MLRFMRTHCSNLCNKRGFTLVEVLAVLVILGILAVVATVSVIGLVEKSREDVCEVNRIELKRMYRMHLEYEGKTDSSLVFREFLLRQDSEICPVGGEIVFENGVVECRVHSVNEEDNNDEDGEVPYL